MHQNLTSVSNPFGLALNVVVVVVVVFVIVDVVVIVVVGQDASRSTERLKLCIRT